MRRVCFALGTWQLAVLLACLDESEPATESRLVLYGPGLPAGMRMRMERMASSRPWSQVVWADDILVKPSTPGGRDAGRCAALRARLGSDEADEIWVCKLFDHPEKVAVETFAQANVVVFEDGLHAAVRQPTVLGRADGLRDEARSVARRCAMRTIWRNDPWWSPGEWAAHRARVTAYWRLSTDARAAERGFERRVSPGGLRRVLGETARDAETEPAPSELVGGIVVLGQAFSLFDLMPRAVELALYGDVCEELLGTGSTVFFKDHPRLEPGFFAELQMRLPELRRGGWADGLPIEAALAGAEPAAVVSATSTALLTLNLLGSVPVYTFADRLRLPVVRRDHRAMVRHVTSRVPVLPRDLRVPAFR